MTSAGMTQEGKNDKPVETSQTETQIEKRTD